MISLLYTHTQTNQRTNYYLFLSHWNDNLYVRMCVIFEYEYECVCACIDEIHIWLKNGPICDVYRKTILSHCIAFEFVLLVVSITALFLLMQLLFCKKKKYNIYL